MKDLKQHLVAGDPLAREGTLAAADAQKIHSRIVEGARTPPGTASRWGTLALPVVVGFALMSAIVAPAQSRHNGFSVVVLRGETQNAAAGESLPPAPALRKALTDVKDFLPYRGYRVLDTHWLRGGSTRMKGL